jgi:dCTP deaminase
MDLSTGPMMLLDLGRWEEIDPHDSQSLENRYQHEKLPFALPPLRRALLSSQEIVEMEEGAAGIICLRSTWARIGLIAPPTIVDPGFKGQLTMEVFNSNLSPLLIRPGDYVWHMLIVQAPDEELYAGRYQGQMGLTLPKAL